MTFRPRDCLGVCLSATGIKKPSLECGAELLRNWLVHGVVKFIQGGQWGFIERHGDEDVFVRARSSRTPLMRRSRTETHHQHGVYAPRVMPLKKIQGGEASCRPKKSSQRWAAGWG